MSSNSNRLIKANHYPTSPFGYRTNPVTGKKEGHNGTDYGTNGKKVPCFAPAEGRVLQVSRDRYGANFVYVEFPALKKVGLYYHLDKVSVKTKQKVKAGQQIGVVGTTGQSTGVHLHFSWIEANSLAMNYYKATYLDFEKYVFEEEEEMTEEQVRKIIREELAGDPNAKPPEWAKANWEKCIKDGIVDGKAPNGYPTRAQVATMIVREE